MDLTRHKSFGFLEVYKFWIRYITIHVYHLSNAIIKWTEVWFLLKRPSYINIIICTISARLTHWGRVTHICVSNLTSIGSVNGLPPDRRQAITWTNAGILLIGPLGTNFSEMRLKVSSAKWRPFCLGLNVLSMLVTSRRNELITMSSYSDSKELVWHSTSK